jgi:hypothetical protein
MKNFTYKTGLLFLLTLLLTITQISCSDDDNSTGPNDTPEDGGQDPALVGTWKLTKILAPIQTTPEGVGIALVAEFNSDGKLQFTTTDAEGTSLDSGTWSTLNGVVTFTLEGEDPVSSPYTVNGNTAIIQSYSFEFDGTPITATLEFTKQ